jgi:protein-tyrosine phosphatase
MGTFLTPNPLSIAGVCNARDLGGYRVQGGHIIPGRLIRGADLSALTPQGQCQLAQYPVRKVIDLRTDSECNAHPDRRPEGAQMRQLDVLKAVLKEHNASVQAMVARMGQHSPAQMLNDIYHAFVAQPSCNAVGGAGLMNCWRCRSMRLCIFTVRQVKTEPALRRRWCC